MNELYQIIRNIRQGNLLELLTLTACETAMGSDRDALQISLQAGARSAVASLWQVDDQSTAQLITGSTKSYGEGKAVLKPYRLLKTWLQQHQRTLQSSWLLAALILVGNCEERAFAQR